jgi:hypothetical protein
MPWDAVLKKPWKNLAILEKSRLPRLDTLFAGRRAILGGN